MRRLALLLCAVLTACDAEVTLGFNRTALTDGGADGGASDGGSSTVDGGFTDAGSSDAGLADGGNLDGGSSDAGTGDAGLDLALGLSVAAATEDSQVLTVTVSSFNLGDVDVVDPRVRVTLPAALTFLSGATCGLVDAGLVECAPGALLARQSRASSFTTQPAAVRGRQDLLATLQAGVSESDLTNNTANALTCITAPTAQSVSVNAPRSATLESCFGVGLTSFSQCTPPSVITATFTLLPDGGTDTQDAGVEGFWGVSMNAHALGLDFTTGGTPGITYCGAATTPSCFEGTSDEPGMPLSGVFRLCLN